MIAFKVGSHWSGAYSSPLLAAMMRPVHEAREPFRVLGTPWRSDGLRTWIADVRISWACELPDVAPTARVAFAVLCARSVCSRPAFVEWADSWIAGKRDPRRAFAALAPVSACDRAYVAHWAITAAAFPNEPTLGAQTAALLAAYVCPTGTFDFETRARTALEIA
jgi:hypothetical protein